MKEKNFYEVVSAIAQFIEKADSDDAVRNVGGCYEKRKTTREEGE